MATNSQIAFNPQGKTVVVAAAVASPLGVQAPFDQRFSAQETGQVRDVNANTTIDCECIKSKSVNGESNWTIK